MLTAIFRQVYLTGFDVEGYGWGCIASVEVYVDPSAVPPVPDSGLLRLLGVSISVSRHKHNHSLGCMAQ